MLHRKRYGNCRSDGNRKVAFGDLYLMISTAAWKSLRKKRSAFSTVPTALTTARPSEIRGTKHNISFTPTILYKLWNRMSSGSYFPPPVRTVKIPKASGGERKLGIPTVADRIAQTVVKAKLEPQIEPLFHPNSFGYRPGRSALDAGLDAVGHARRNCWDHDWVLDLDVRGFFDNLDWELLMKAVKKHAQEPWVVLYIERWLKTPAQEEDGTLVERTSGTPQGGVISPLLANLFLHYAFDVWMVRQFPHLPFER